MEVEFLISASWFLSYHWLSLRRVQILFYFFITYLYTSKVLPELS